MQHRDRAVELRLRAGAACDREIDLAELLFLRSYGGLKEQSYQGRRAENAGYASAAHGASLDSGTRKHDKCLMGNASNAFIVPLSMQDCYHAQYESSPPARLRQHCRCRRFRPRSQLNESKPARAFPTDSRAGNRIGRVAI